MTSLIKAIRGAASLLVIIMVILFYVKGYEDLILIPILTNGVGDGLAEPIGIRFGRIKYVG